MGRLLSAGSGGLYQTVLPVNLVINVGATRAFTSIAAALASLTGKYPLGTVSIQLDDGTYNETTLTFSDPNLSGKLSIQGNLTTPSNCVINFTDQGSRGFYAINGFYLILNGGYVVNGLFDVTTNQYTFTPLFADISSTIVVNNGNTITFNNSIFGMFSTGRISFDTGSTFNGVFRGIQCDAKGCVLGKNFTFIASTTQIVTITNAQMAGWFYAYSATYPSTLNGMAGETGQQGDISCPYSTFSGFNAGLDSSNGSNIYAAQCTYSNIVNTALSADLNGNLSSTGSTFFSCGSIASAYMGGNIDIDNPAAINGCGSIANASTNGTISAAGSSGFTVSGTKYSPATSGTAGADGGLVVWS